MGLLAKILGSLQGPGSITPAHGPGNLTAIEDVLKHVPPERARFLAAYALLLGRVAYADVEVSAKERARMKAIVEQEAEISETQAQAVVNLALERTVAQPGENHLVLRSLRDLTDRAERVRILRSLFALACEDDISQIENAEIRSVAEALGFSHREFIDLRSEYREHLSILKKTASET